VHMCLYAVPAIAVVYCFVLYTQCLTVLEPCVSVVCAYMYSLLIFPYSQTLVEGDLVHSISHSLSSHPSTPPPTIPSSTPLHIPLLLILPSPPLSQDSAQSDIKVELLLKWSKSRTDSAPTASVGIPHIEVNRLIKLKALVQV